VASSPSIIGTQRRRGFRKVRGGIREQQVAIFLSTAVKLRRRKLLVLGISFFAFNFFTRTKYVHRQLFLYFRKNNIFRKNEDLPAVQKFIVPSFPCPLSFHDASHAAVNGGDRHQGRKLVRSTPTRAGV